MSLYYTHLLIPENCHFVPPTSEVANFLEGAIALGVFGDTPDISCCTMKKVSHEERRGRNPMTGEEIVIPARRMKWPDQTSRLARASNFPEAIGNAPEYNLDASALVQPPVPPLPIDFSEPYHLRIGCRLRALPASMWSAFDGSPEAFIARRFGFDSPTEESTARFRHPQSLKIIEVPGAGRARFWIEVGLGKNLCPKIEGTNLAILNPQIVELACTSFGQHFQQGCQWG